DGGSGSTASRRPQYVNISNECIWIWKGKCAGIGRRCCTRKAKRVVSRIRGQLICKTRSRQTAQCTRSGKKISWERCRRCCPKVGRNQHIGRVGTGSVEW